MMEDGALKDWIYEQKNNRQNDFDTNKIKQLLINLSRKCNPQKKLSVKQHRTWNISAMKKSY